MFKKLFAAVAAFLSRNAVAVAGAASVMFLFAATAVIAGDGTTGVATGVTTTGAIATDAFDTTWSTIAVWMSGALGRSIAAVMILAGVAMGVARMSVLAVLPGLLAAFTMFLGPQIIETIVAASL